MEESCFEDYLYLYKDKKWEVRTPFSNSFIDLNLALKGDLMIKEIMQITKKQESTSTKSNVLLKLEEEKINKSYDFMKLGTTQDEKDLFLQMLVGAGLSDEVHNFVKMKETILLNEKLTNDLKEVKTSHQKKI